jgi:hypothetical protein
MAPVSTRDVSNITLDELSKRGLNPFAIQLLVESYARGTAPPPPPITFVWRGVTVSLSVYDGETK